MVNILCRVLPLLIFCHTGLSLAQDQCYALLRIRMDEDNTSHLGGITFNPDEALTVTLDRSKISYNTFFEKMTDLCSNYCAAREDDCIGYLTGNFIEVNNSRNPETVLKQLSPTYSSRNYGIQNPVKETDCVCIKKNDTNRNLTNRYDELKQSFRTADGLFAALQATVTFWIELYNELVTGPDDREDCLLENSLDLRQQYHQ